MDAHVAAGPGDGTRDTAGLVDTVVLDIDGTLVDSNYHHVLAWARAFAAVDREVPLWRIHRGIGMGGDRLVPHLIGVEADAEIGDRVRELWEREVAKLLPETRLLPWTGAFLDLLGSTPVKVVLASSGKPDHVRRAVELLADATETPSVLDHVTSAEDAATKPAPDLIERAIASVDGSCALVVGDSVWDASAARRAGARMIGVLTGGFGEAELIEAGAERVSETLQGLIEDWEEIVAGPGPAAPRGPM